MKISKKFTYFIVMLALTAILFMPFLQKHYATDTYNIASLGYKNYAINYSFNDGRLVMGVICLIADTFNVNIDTFVLTLTLLALLTSCFACITLKELFLKIKPTDKLLNEIIVLIICYFTIFNFMYIENMLFVESFVMAISVLLYITAANFLINKEKIYMAGLYLFLGILCYQGTFSMYLITLLVFSILKNEKYKKIMLDLILGGFLLVCFVGLQLMIIKLNGAIFGVQQNRIAEFNSMVPRFILILKSIPKLIIYTGFVYTKYLYIMFVLILGLLSFIKVKIEKKPYKIMLNIILIMVFSILFGTSISFIGLTAFWSARIRFSIGTTIGFSCLYLYCTTDTNLKRVQNIFIAIVFLAYSFTIIFNYVEIMKNHLKVNEYDKKSAIEIVKYIENYEKENQIVVNKLAIFKGNLKNKTYYRNLKYFNSVLSWSSIRTEWAIEGTLEMYSNRDFTKIDTSENMIEYYMNNVDKERDYMCIGDTLYISYYMY